MNRKALYQRLLSGAVNNIDIDDIIDLANGFGFVLKRTRGSHNVLECSNIPEIINLQHQNGQAKPYQIKQLLKLIKAYNLKLRE